MNPHIDTCPHVQAPTAPHTDTHPHVQVPTPWALWGCSAPTDILVDQPLSLPHSASHPPLSAVQRCAGGPAGEGKEQALEEPGEGCSGGRKRQGRGEDTGEAVEWGWGLGRSRGRAPPQGTEEVDAYALMHSDTP